MERPGCDQEFPAFPALSPPFLPVPPAAAPQTDPVLPSPSGLIHSGALDPRGSVPGASAGHCSHIPAPQHPSKGLPQCSAWLLRFPPGFSSSQPWAVPVPQPPGHGSPTDCSGSRFPHSGPGTRLPQLPTLPSPKGKALQGCSGSCTEPLGGFKPPSHLCPSPVAPQVWPWCPWGRAVPGQLSVPPAPWGTPEPPEQPSPCQSHPPGQTTPGLWEPSLETGWGPCRTLRLGTAIPPGDEPPSERTEPGTAQGWHIIPPDPLPALGLAASPGSGQEMLRKGTEALEKP